MSFGNCAIQLPAAIKTPPDHMQGKLFLWHAMSYYLIYVPIFIVCVQTFPGALSNKHQNESVYWTLYCQSQFIKSVVSQTINFYPWLVSLGNLLTFTVRSVSLNRFTYNFIHCIPVISQCNSYNVNSDVH